MATSMFSRRHYEAIAEVIRGLDCEDLAKLRVRIAFSELFEADNPRFDWRKFEEECNQ